MKPFQTPKADTSLQTRFGLISTTTLAVFFGLFCLLWKAARSVDYGQEMYLFLAATGLHLIATTCALLLGRTWKRWLLLLLAIPCLLILADRLIMMTKVMTSQ